MEITWSSYRTSPEATLPYYITNGRHAFQTRMSSLSLLSQRLNSSKNLTGYKRFSFMRDGEREKKRKRKKSRRQRQLLLMRSCCVVTFLPSLPVS